ncbi:MAG TPA: aldose 1-epimerase family protein [Actinomycetota bacterium]|nr:aldose 1-epimerase family protein [Actinomycetota bacterium]
MAIGAVAAPSGVQHAIASGAFAAVVTEVGATLRVLTVDGEPVIDGFDEHQLASAGRGQILAPWPNRLEDGSYDFDGRRASAALSEPERGNAIHGLVRWLPWQVDTSSADALDLSCTLHPSPGYPWRIDLAIRYALVPTGLEVTFDATNRSASTAPFGVGFHPYVRAGGGTIDGARLTVPAATRLLTDERALPVGTQPVEGTPFDLREGEPIGTAVLDTGFTDLIRDRDGLAVVELDDERTLRVWMDAAFPWVQVYTGDTLDPVARRRHGVAIEPMSCPPNALRTGTDVVNLGPGQGWSGRWGIDA